MDSSLVAGTLLLMNYWRLVRPRIVAMVLMAMAVSAWTTTASPPSLLTLAYALFGVALVIAGSMALNQQLEREGDAKMRRTAARPLPAGRLSLRQVAAFGIGASVVGLAFLALTTNPLLTFLTALSWLLYVGIYTPMKLRTKWQTPVGAASGAMPVLLGAAIDGTVISQWSIVLFGIVFLWQVPHSMAIAWRYRHEFASAGVQVATVTDPTGRTAGTWAIFTAVMLLLVSLAPVVLAPVVLGPMSIIYTAVAVVLGAAYLAMSVAFARDPNDLTARRLLLTSLVYLPAMLVAFLAL